MADPVAPYDAVLLQSFGGPERPEEVMPFLRNVVRGRDVPEERLASVAEHYHARGGRSPINDLNRALRDDLAAELARRGTDVGVLWGNRNWHPLVVDTLRDAYRDGARRIVSVVTSAYSSYSGCRQYWDDLAHALSALHAEGAVPDGDLVVDRIRPYFNHPAFVDANARALTAALGRLEARASGVHPRIVYVTHSVPVAMDQWSGPGGGAYSTQHRAVAETCTAAAAPGLDWDLVYCSRSGPPGRPWLEPDVGDHLRTLAERGVAAVVLAPIGFVSDHMEVVHDLDDEAGRAAAGAGLTMERCATVGTDPRFVEGLVDLVLERAALARGERVDVRLATALPALPVPCRPGCCPAPAAPGRH